nr:MAG TPA: hypothetical protein [Caudoviricetes sp.]
MRFPKLYRTTNIASFYYLANNYFIFFSTVFYCSIFPMTFV